MEWIGLKRTPMGTLLEFLGLEQDFAMQADRTTCWD